MTEDTRMDNGPQAGVAAPRKRPVAHLAWALVLVLGYVGGWFAWHWFATRTVIGLSMFPRVASSHELVENLEANREQLVLAALNKLGERGDPSGRDKALSLLESEDCYLWYSAAGYLGQIGDPVAIPYLIKGLKHPAWRSYAQTAAQLEALTGESFGQDQRRWRTWWHAQHPESDFDFAYADLKAKARELGEGGGYLINGAADPLRISHVGPLIRLVGIRLKPGADPEAARTLLATLVTGQVVALEFDLGPALDEAGARRALVYWTGAAPDGPPGLLRKNLGPVPFSERTLINTYLLGSGLYELDLDAVQGDRVRAILRDAAGGDGGGSL